MFSTGKAITLNQLEEVFSEKGRELEGEIKGDFLKWKEH
jgi:hypothetical protein